MLVKVGSEVNPNNLAFSDDSRSCDFRKAARGCSIPKLLVRCVKQHGSMTEGDRCALADRVERLDVVSPDHIFVRKRCTSDA
jgi:hypothetical protein